MRSSRPSREEGWRAFDFCPCALRVLISLLSFSRRFSSFVCASLPVMLCGTCLLPPWCFAFVCPCVRCSRHVHSPSWEQIEAVLLQNPICPGSLLTDCPMFMQCCSFLQCSMSESLPKWGFFLRSDGLQSSVHLFIEAGLVHAFEVSAYVDGVCSCDFIQHAPCACFPDMFFSVSLSYLRMAMCMEGVLVWCMPELTQMCWDVCPAAACRKYSGKHNCL